MFLHKTFLLRRDFIDEILNDFKRPVQIRYQESCVDVGMSVLASRRDLVRLEDVAVAVHLGKDDLQQDLSVH